jgi:periplasmic protein TonB
VFQLIINPKLSFITLISEKTSFQLLPCYFFNCSHFSKCRTSSIEGKTIFTKAEKAPQFPGGPEGWRLYLQHNLNVGLASRVLKVPEGKTQLIQTAKVKFIVDENGKASNLRIINPDEVHPQLAKEAIRVIKKGPKWIPAEQNGSKVTFENVQSISWLIRE